MWRQKKNFPHLTCPINFLKTAQNVPPKHGADENLLATETYVWSGCIFGGSDIEIQKVFF